MPMERRIHTLPSFRWMEPMPASPAVQVGDLLFIGGQTALDENGRAIAPGDVAAQTRHIFDRIGELLEAAGGTTDDLVDIISFHKDPRDMDAVFDTARDYLTHAKHPAWTAVGSQGFWVSENLLGIRAIAHLGQARKDSYTPDTMKWLRQFPMAGGCRKGDLLFVSGQMAADADGFITTPGDHAAQARYAINRIREIVEMAGASMDDVIDLIAFNRDARGMDAAVDTWMEEVVSNVHPANAPTVTSIGTTGLYRLGLLGAYRVIADLSPGPRVAQTPPSIWWHTLPIAGGCKKEGGHLITIAGEVASDGDGNIITPGNTATQARYAFNRIKEVLEAFGASMEHVVEVMSFHKDPRAWERVMKVGEEFFSKEKGPAWTPAGTTGLYKEGYLHEIYATAVV
ncbi:MAG: Rid family hydrolase [Chloroflexi bacterium]|nr:Rid family hydrolase [Chloroflexota bacterium]